MDQVLIVIESEEFGQRLYKDLKKDFIPLLCHNADDAALLMEQKPDALILEMGLPGTDGLTFLENLPWRPPVMLTLSASYTPYEAQKLLDLGVGYRLRTPCSLRAVTGRLRDMMRQRNNDNNDEQNITALHLTRLGISSSEGGGKQLRVAIPLFAQDREQKISAELYPAVARICGSTVSCVEHNMRRTIEQAWNKRDPESWAEYFPNSKRYPSNKMFLSALAKKLG